MWRGDEDSGGREVVSLLLTDLTGRRRKNREGRAERTEGRGEEWPGGAGATIVIKYLSSSSSNPSLVEHLPGQYIQRRLSLGSGEAIWLPRLVKDQNCAASVPSSAASSSPLKQTHARPWARGPVQWASSGTRPGGNPGLGWCKLPTPPAWRARGATAWPSPPCLGCCARPISLLGVASSNVSTAADVLAPKSQAWRNRDAKAWLKPYVCRCAPLALACLHLASHAGGRAVGGQTD